MWEKKNYQVGVICTVCSRSNALAPFENFQIFLWSYSFTASGTGEKKPEMIVECIGNKANGMAGLTQEVASEVVHQQQPGEERRGPPHAL